MTDSNLAQDVQSLFDLQDTMKMVAAETKLKRDPLKKRIEELQERIKTYMESDDLFTIHYSEERLERQVVTRHGSLSKASLLKALKHVLGDDKGETTFNEILDFVGKKEVTVLRRYKGKKKTSKDEAEEEEEAETPAPAPTATGDDAEPPELGDSDSD